MSMNSVLANTGNLDAFEAGSGMSANWFNHWLLGLSGTLIVIAAAAIVAMLVHRLGVVDDMHRHIVVIYMIFVVLVVMLVLGFLNSFWR